MPRPGIHFRLMFSAFLLFLIAFAIIGYLGAGMVQRFVLTRFQERNDFLTEYLAANAELGILIENKSALKKLAQNLAEEKDVAKIEIFDKQGDILALVDKESQGPYMISKSPVYSEKIVQDRREFSSGPEGTRANLVGKVQITYSLQEINSLMHSLYWKLLVLAVGVVLSSLIVFYVISRSLVVPISRLAQTARKVAVGERELRAQPGKVPETKDMAVAFNTMLDSLEWSSKALEEAYQEMMQQKTMAELGRFSMIIAHEVKNPLGIIKSSFDILKKDLEIAQGNTMVEYIEDEILRLNRLIEEFLNFSRPAKADFQPTEINGAVNDWVLRFEIQLNETDLRINNQISGEKLYINIDADLLCRAFNNLLKNAMQVSEERGVIMVSTSTRENLWVLAVHDNGPGVDDELKEKIFEPFFTTKAKGTGLGLSFVQQVVHVHKGRITMENSANQGAIFTISLPLD